jgi:hypothetical protein
MSLVVVKSQSWQVSSWQQSQESKEGFVCVTTCNIFD